MNIKIKIAVIALGTVLLALIVLTGLVGRRPPTIIQRDILNVLPEPVPAGLSGSGTGIRQSPNRPLTGDESSSVAKLRSLTSPTHTEKDFEMGYSNKLNQFFVYKKTRDANKSLNTFFTENGLNSLKNLPAPYQLINYVYKPVTQAIQETESQEAQIINGEDSHGTE